MTFAYKMKAAARFAGRFRRHHRVRDGRRQVSIFGLIFGVAATTTNAGTVLIAGASGAVAAAVSMMAGTFLDAETTGDETKVKRAALKSALAADPAAITAAFPQPAGGGRFDAAAIRGADRRSDARY